MRLINADAIKYTMLYKENWLKGTGVEKQGVWKEDIDAMPTVDAVPTEFIMENYNLEFVCDALTDDDEWCSKRCQYSEPPSECIHRYIDRIWRREHD